MIWGPCVITLPSPNTEMTGRFARSAPGASRPPAMAMRSTRSFEPRAHVATPQPLGDGDREGSDGPPVGPGVAVPGMDDGLAPAPATQPARSSAPKSGTARAVAR